MKASNPRPRLQGWPSTTSKQSVQCDDTGMYRTVRSANPTYRERESTRIDQVVDPIARDSETRFNTCLGLKRPE
jgi:hypothetical protein